MDAQQLNFSNMSIHETTIALLGTEELPMITVSYVHPEISNSTVVSTDDVIKFLLTDFLTFLFC